MIITTVLAVPAPAAIRERADDAWWTGPIIANSPNTLAPGHLYAETYAYDVRSAYADGFNSQTYLLYGLADRLTVGMIPTFGFNRIRQSSSRPGAGDLTIQAQYQISRFDAARGTPALAIAIQEAFPTGTYDHLLRAGDGLGNGAHTTTLGLYGQELIWLANGRILRTRINVTRSFPGRAHVEGKSTYGTAASFRGTARPGGGLTIDSSWEYSLTRWVVLATDLYYRRSGRTGIEGADAAGKVADRTDRSTTIAIAPAVEYCWTSNLGVLVGAPHTRRREQDAFNHPSRRAERLFLITAARGD